MTPEAEKKQAALFQQFLTMLTSCNPRELLWIAEAARKKTIEELDRYRGQHVMLGAGFLPIPHYMAALPGEPDPDREGVLERVEDQLRGTQHRIDVIDSICRLLDFMSMQASVSDIVAAIRQNQQKEGASK